jgi:hypothetical protein
MGFDEIGWDHASFDRHGAAFKIASMGLTPEWLAVTPWKKGR